MAAAVNSEERNSAQNENPDGELLGVTKQKKAQKKKKRKRKHPQPIVRAVKSRKTARNITIGYHRLLAEKEKLEQEQCGLSGPGRKKKLREVGSVFSCVVLSSLVVAD